MTILIIEINHSPKPPPDYSEQIAALAGPDIFFSWNFGLWSTSRYRVSTREVADAAAVGLRKLPFVTSVRIEASPNMGGRQ